MVRLGLVAMLALAARGADMDAREIMRRATSLNDENWKRARNYTFVQRSEERQYDGAGRVKSKASKTYDITLLEGSPYRRLVARDDSPLPPKEEQKEQETLSRSIEERRKETPEQRAKRLADYASRRERERATMHEIFDAFDFHSAGEETMDGRPVYVIDATPRPGYRPKDNRTRFLPKLKGRVWIDKSEYQWAKLEAEVIDNVSLGLFLFRLAKGARLDFEQTRVNDEVWLPRRAVFSGSARIGLVKKVTAEQEFTFSEFRKFQTDSRMVDTGQVR